MIVYGSRIYGRKDLVQGWGYCLNCGKYGKNSSYTGRKWVHLYFIPLVPLGRRSRIVMECKKCSHGLHYVAKDLPETIRILRESTGGAMTALLAGEKKFNNNNTGNEEMASGFLAGAVGLLLSLQEDDYLNILIGVMQEKKLTFAYHMVLGASLEFRGNLDAAVIAYKDAISYDSDDAQAYISLGAAYVMKSEIEDAREAYEKALELSEDKFQVIQILLGIYEDTKDYLKLAEAYEACFELVPGLSQDKKILKAYRKSCDRAGREARIFQ